ncbi:Phosphorylated carbohydrates phosphatase [Thalassoglobus neptunius]|uniref:Phosphorylated carbohydrates phosphatase n=1 Tax=Thalassoglobus neptunius TaxID=1938619 RepID=A0A5C5X4W2_9PLAN|nr:HAD-IA family hydrolase [Thalassoglobus neptunius]TWT58046.1 Phosphorylated carbohydrates phosphatase [Thalassoglobus neptunius]
MSKPEIRAVAFDLDGLMFNTEEVFNRTGTEVLRRRGKVPHPELFLSMMGRRADEAFQVMIDMMELTDSIPELKLESEEVFGVFLDEMVAPMPGLLDLLDRIEQRNLPKAVATSSHRDFLEKLLNRFELMDRFHHTLTAEDVSLGKPHPEIYLTAAERLNVRPEQMLVLEDSENGTLAAAAAGAHVISVPHEISRHHDFSKAKGIATSLADPVIHDLLI